MIECNIYNAITDIHYDFEQHAAILLVDNVILIFKFIYCVEIFYVLIINFIKFFILLFYRRMFFIKSFVIVLWIIKFISTIWMIAIILSIVFQCSFIFKTWNFILDDRCIDIVKLIFDNAIFNIMMNIVIVLVSILLIWKLKIILNQKFAVCEVFFMNGLWITLIHKAQIVVHGM